MSQKEADGIVLSALRASGWTTPGADVQSLKDFTCELLVSCTTELLKKIPGASRQIDCDALPTSMGKSIAAKHRHCTALARIISGALGYSGNCGYNQFLYPTSTDTRQILLFLLAALPKDDGGEEGEGKLDVPGDGQAGRQIFAALKHWRRALWTPSFCVAATPQRRSSPLVRVADATSLVESGSIFDMSKEQDAYAGKWLHLVTSQPEVSVCGPCPSIIATNDSSLARAADRDSRRQLQAGGEEANAGQQQERWKSTLREAFSNVMDEMGDKADRRGGRVNPGMSTAQTLTDILNEYARDSDRGGRGGLFAHDQSFGQEQDGGAGDDEVDIETLAKQRAQELEAMRGKLDEIVGAINAAEATCDDKDARARQVEAGTVKETAKTREMERQYLVKKTTLDMLPNASENMQKLKRICASSAEKLVKLGKEWEVHRIPLVNEARRLRTNVAMRKSECRWKVKEMKRMRGEMTDMMEDIRGKEARGKSLKAQHAKLPKNVNRALYTYRILDIIKQVGKQKAEIARIIGDIRQVQKDMNKAEDRLARQEALADEVLFRAAEGRNKEAADVEAYKQLAILRQLFEELIATAHDTGKTENAIRVLQQRTEQIQARVTIENVSRVVTDLREIKKENAALLKQAGGLR